jgi:hypothetical protein
MRKIAIVISFALLASVGAASAGGEIQRTMAEELMKLTKVDQQMAAVRTQIQQAVTAQMDAMTIPEDQKEQAARMQKKMIDLIFEELSWKNLKDDMINVYADVFTQEELAGLINFYRSPLGQALVEKGPELSKRTIAVSQSHAQSLMPRIQQMMEDEVGRIEEEKTPPEDK